jgi:hypothetical protein
MISEVSAPGFSTNPDALSKPMWVGWGLVRSHIPSLKYPTFDPLSDT